VEALGWHFSGYFTSARYGTAAPLLGNARPIWTANAPGASHRLFPQLRSSSAAGDSIECMAAEGDRTGVRALLNSVASNDSAVPSVKRASERPGCALTAPAAEISPGPGLLDAVQFGDWSSEGVVADIDNITNCNISFGLGIAVAKSRP
jgi:hypothetical protein